MGLGGLIEDGRTRRQRAIVVALVALFAGSATGSFGYPRESRSATQRAHAGSLAAAHAAAAAARAGSEVVAAQSPRHLRGGRAYYRRIASGHVPAAVKAGFLPLYREAARTFGVSWRLIASIRRQETAFSTAAGTYHGLNAFGCCAGPMQFNVKNGPVSTWKLYRNSYRLADRPRHYPHRTRSHPSVYDDFDAIMAAGALLADAGAGEALDRAAWSAAYAYYGHDLFGVRYASEVMGRALGWEIDGFCLNCPVNDTLVDTFDDAYGIEARRDLRRADRRGKQARRKKQQHGDQARKARHKAKRDKAPDRASDRDRKPTTPAPAKRAPSRDPRPPTTTSPPTVTTQAPPEPAAPPPQAERCTLLSRLLGCGR